MQAQPSIKFEEKWEAGHRRSRSSIPYLTEAQRWSILQFRRRTVCETFLPLRDPQRGNFVQNTRLLNVLRLVCLAPLRRGHQLALKKRQFITSPAKSVKPRTLDRRSERWKAVLVNTRSHPLLSSIDTWAHMELPLSRISNGRFWQFSPMQMPAWLSNHFS